MRENLRKLVVGDTVYLENLSGQLRNRANEAINARRISGIDPLLTSDIFAPLLEEAVVTAVGRKYITVSQGKYREHKFDLETGRQKTEYSPEYEIFVSKEAAEESIRTPFLYFAVKTELSKYPAYASWKRSNLPPVKIEQIADVLGIGYDWHERSDPPCYNPEKDNPYPLCQGRGMAACAHCGIWKDYDESEDEDRAKILFDWENNPCSRKPEDILWVNLLKCLPASPEEETAHKKGFWTDGDMILCKSESCADAVANFLEACGFGVVVTGSYNPKEDARDNCEDCYTGWHYVDID